jgi:3-oxoacyl-[acyl-carrier-protein] synthase-1
MSKRVFVTGMGIITSIGTDVPTHLESLMAKRSGFGQIDILPSTHKGVIPVCEIKKTTAQLCDQVGVPQDEGYTRSAVIGIIAIQEALRSAGIRDIKSHRTGLISSSTVGGIREFEEALTDLCDLSKESDQMAYAHVADIGEHTERMADFFGIHDYVNTVSTACSSACNAMILGAELIKHGILDRVICGGTDVLSKFTLNGFNSLMILDREHTRPFDATRAGLNLGEGAAFVVLESETLARGEGKTIYGELTGYSNSNDAFHQTASSPNGDGAMLSMRRAITMAGLQPGDIDYINCHGTATENNDLSEALAMQNLFGDTMPLFSSTKPYTGHTLAAAGGVETVFSLLAMNHNVVFPNLNFSNQMPEIKISPVREIITDREVKHVLCNSFGFGGSNTSLVFSKVSD